MKIQVGQPISLKYKTLKVIEYCTDTPFLFNVEGLFNAPLLSFGENKLWLNIKVFTKKEYELVYTNPYAHHFTETHTDTMGIQFSSHHVELGQKYRIILDPDIDVHSFGLYYLVPVDKFIPYGDYLSPDSPYYFKKIGKVEKLPPNLLEFDSKIYLNKEYSADSLSITLLSIVYQGKILNELELTKNVQSNVIKNNQVDVLVSMEGISHMLPLYHFNLKT